MEITLEMHSPDYLITSDYITLNRGRPDSFDCNSLGELSPNGVDPMVFSLTYFRTKGKTANNLEVGEVTTLLSTRLGM